MSSKKSGEMTMWKRFYLKWIHGTYLYKLEEDYTYQSKILGYSYENKWMTITEDGIICVRKGYCWDGCTPKLNFFDLFIFGPSDGVIHMKTMKPKAYYGSLVHDVLYQFYGKHGIPRKEIDPLLYEMLERDEFYPAKLYFFVVQKLGGVFFKKYKVLCDDQKREWIPERHFDE